MTDKSEPDFLKTDLLPGQKPIDWSAQRQEARVRTIQPLQGARVDPVKRYQAGCIYCDWWGMRYRSFQRAVNQMSRHNAEKHPFVR